MLDVLRKIVQEVNAADDLEAALKLIVKRVQRSMRTQVCSVYLLDPASQEYVLMATEGLNQEAVGNIRLAPAEGVVGKVASRAEPINLENVADHPSYRYMTGSGEENFHSFLGAPIIHQRKVLGVLVVQQKKQRRFDESEEAFLITMSAQLAGVIAHAEVTGAISVNHGGEGIRKDARFDGVSGAQGVGLGVAMVVSPPADLDAVPDQRIEDIDAELERFRSALTRVRHDIKVVGRSLARRLKGEEQALFDVYLRMLDDNALAGEIEHQIKQGQWAPGALRRVVHEHVHQFEMMDDAYLRERATDIRDLGRRVLACLQEGGATSCPIYPDNMVLVAEEVTPAMLGEVPTDKLVGLVSVNGSGNSHAAILARSMGIPTVMGAVDLPATRVHKREIIIDGYSGRVFVDPSDELTGYYADIMQEEQELSRGLEQLRDLPAQTQDGHRVPLWVNTGLITDVSLALQRGAEGVGLYRSEVPFMIKEFFPSEAEQIESYRRQLEPFAPSPVTMRTLDIGGDKSLSYFPIDEDNPSLGWRGIRVTLDHPEIFLVQVRAMLLASEGLDNLRILLPMVASVVEVDEAVALINQAFAELVDDGYQLIQPEIGVMVEVPAAVYQVRHFAKRVDFLSVGSNDLTQYLLAVDRNNPRVADLYDSYHPAVLTALKQIVDEAHREQVQVSICGELAGEPIGALLLMAMGYDVLSMSSTSLPKVKSAIRGVSSEQAKLFLDTALSFDEPESVRQALEKMLADAGLGHLDRPHAPQ
ncbi:phosphoenolpyruvate-protein phosphotransferase PtsP [Motiliproteus coralliicola]|uniref:phosphoenolpyruvate--protein phosphotransferase n=1 Tax=Motiliproteus coralliicola TaxID=2283196 RepID=A0A369WA41_9GAMM|nr:phosphoenolpyruvate--protein phosphotransferase [Motiliproteus coralliicola]RDE18173.1 phosphoenolpyruvate-protein phosphotransferase PtsP [Motiliproteus coralliicola]